METNLATKLTTNQRFCLDFDKKKMTPGVQACELKHRELTVYLKNPLIQKKLERKTQEKVIVSAKTMEIMIAFSDWVKALPSPGLSPLYQIILLGFYLKDDALMCQQLKSLGFGAVAEIIYDQYSKNTREQIEDQQVWFNFFIKNWKIALQLVDKNIQTHCLQACYQVQAQSLLTQKKINERQYQLVIQLQNSVSIRDKKSLLYCSWYRALYKGLTKRTQERDFNLICEEGFVQRLGKSKFEVSI